MNVAAGFRQGQQTSANSVPVVIASDQSAIPISGSVTATNPSVGTTGAAAPASTTQVGGSYNTSLPTLTNGELGSAQLDSSSRLLIGSIAGALPAGANIIGAVTQSGAWTVTANAGTGTFAISAASLPLPANAAQETGGNLATIASNTARPSTATSFQVSSTTTATQFATNTAKAMAVKALSTNTDSVFIGGSSVSTANGYILAPGDAISMDVTNSNDIWSVANSGTQTLTVLVTN